MSKLKSLIKHPRARWAILGGAGSLVVGTGIAVATIAAPTPAPPPMRPIVMPKVAVKRPTPPKPVIPFTGADRLAQLDAARAELEFEKVQAAIAKARAERREADSPGMGGIAPVGGATGGANLALPPLPALPAGGVYSSMPPATSLDMPPLPPSRGGRSVSGFSSGGGSMRSASSGSVEILEAWGTGGDLQARVMTSGGERIVRVGDQLAGGKVTSISGDSIAVRDSKGKQRIFQ